MNSQPMLSLDSLTGFRISPIQIASGQFALAGLLISITCGLLPSGVAMAQSELQVETILSGLHLPCGVAVQPETGEIYVSESGNQKIIRVVDGAAQDAIVGFASSIQENRFPFDIGPLGLDFLDEKHLIIGSGGNGAGKDSIYVVDLSLPDRNTVNIADAAYQAQLVQGDDDAPASGNFFGVTVSPVGIYATSLGDLPAAWIARWDLENNKPKELDRFVNTTESANTPTPSAITISPDGFITVGLMGEKSADTDSLLTFYDESSKELKASFKLELRDITALAYSPNANRLFALDASFAEPDEGGLFKLVGRDHNSRCECIRLLTIEHPTAMAFDPAGNLYITTLGPDITTASDGGKLIKVTGLDVADQAAADAASREVKKN